MRKIDSEEIRPVKQLKGFQRVSLQKNESKTVEFKLDRNAMSYWNKENNFVVEPGVYEVQVGASSADIRQSVQFTVR